MMLCSATYCFVAYYCVSYQLTDKEQAFLPYLASTPGYLAFIFYIKVVRLYLGLGKNVLVDSVQKISYVLICTFVFLFFLYFFEIYPIPVVEEQTNIFYKAVAGPYAVPDSIRFVFLLQFLTIITLNTYLLIYIYRNRLREKLIVLGLITSLVVLSLDIWIEYLPYIFPLFGLSYLFETLRIRNLIAVSVTQTKSGFLLQLKELSAHSTFNIILSSIHHDVKPALKVLKSLASDQELALKSANYIEERIKTYQGLTDSIDEKAEMITILEAVNYQKELLQNRLIEKEITVTVLCSNEIIFPLRNIHLFIVLQNLFTNAIKANCGEIKILCFEKDNKIELLFRDNGTNFKEKDFKEFEGIKVLADLVQPGRGLDIIRQIINLYYGEMMISRRKGVTEFRIVVPKNES
tara:strand:- start:12839 stop:14056 length:1218 start_codon:yes stop_codon:yes gene_type:complete